MSFSASKGREFRRWSIGVLAVTVTAVSVWALCQFLFAPSNAILANPPMTRAIHVATLDNVGPAIAWAHRQQTLVGEYAPRGQNPESHGIAVWDRNQGARPFVGASHASSVEGLFFSPNDRQIASISMDGSAIVWDAAERRAITTLRGHRGQTWDVAWSPDGRNLATVGDDRVLVLWDVENGQIAARLGGPHPDRLVRVAWHPTRPLLACGMDSSTDVWDSEQQRRQGHFQGCLLGTGWSPDGKHLATVRGARVDVWNAETGESVAELVGNGGRILCAAWSPDGKRLATGSRDNGGFWRGMVPDVLLGGKAQAVVWDVAAGKPLLTLEGHSHHIGTIAWHPSGNRLATGSWDKTVIVWDTQDGTRRAVLTGFPEVVQTVAWSFDGMLLATAFGSFDNTTSVWSFDVK